MEKIKKRLRAGGFWDSIVEFELKALWKYGIEKISDLETRNSIVSFLEHEAPLGFFVNPASKSNKHHPVWQNEKAGILRNTTECCVLADAFIKPYPKFCNESGDVLPEPRDIVLAATILSDTFKYGEEIVAPFSGKTPVLKNHGQVAANKWLAMPDVSEIKTSCEIYMATYWHLGIWTPGWTKETKFSDLTKITHTIDSVLADKSFELLYTPKHFVG